MAGCQSCREHAGAQDGSLEDPLDAELDFESYKMHVIKTAKPQYTPINNRTPPPIWLLARRIQQKFGRVCINCGKPLDGRRERYCSDRCAEEFYDIALWERIKQRVCEKARWRCQRCGKPTDMSGDEDTRPEIHHIVPDSRGGSFLDEGNLMLLCKACHNAVHEELREKEAYEAMRKSGQTFLVDFEEGDVESN